LGVRVVRQRVVVDDHVAQLHLRAADGHKCRISGVEGTVMVPGMNGAVADP
jgi:hypothetical protein